MFYSGVDLLFFNNDLFIQITSEPDYRPDWRQAEEHVIRYVIRGENESPPELFGRAFERDETFNLWALHVHVWKHDPDGLFAAWNATNSCDYDPKA